MAKIGRPAIYTAEEYIEHRREYMRLYMRKHRDRWGYSAARHAALSSETRRDRAHRYAMKYMFGLTPQQYTALLEVQGGRCACCGDEPNSKRLHVDHDHACCPGKRSCGKCIRGLLCDQCNFGIGLFKDDTRRLERAIKYLQGVR